MASLNQIVNSIAARVDRIADAVFVNEMKHLIKVKRSQYMQQWLQQFPEKRYYFLQEGLVPMIKTDRDFAAVHPSQVWRSERTIPKPVHFGQDEFDYVGERTGQVPIQRWNPDWGFVLPHAPFTPKRPKWFFADNYLYFLNYKIEDTEVITFDARIRAVFDQPEFVNQIDATTRMPYSEDDEFPIAQDLLNMILREIYQEMTGTPQENEEEVNVDEQDMTKNT